MSKDDVINLIKYCLHAEIVLNLNITLSNCLATSIVILSLATEAEMKNGVAL